MGLSLSLLLNVPFGSTPAGSRGAGFNQTLGVAATEAIEAGTGGRLVSF